MKPHPGVRRAIKWTGAPASVLLLAAWIGSGWHAVSWTGSGGARWELSEGRLTFNHLQIPMPETYRGVRFGRTRRFTLQWDLWVRNPRYMWKIAVPLWLFPPPIFAPTILAWRTDIIDRRRRRAGVCRGCGYERTGLPPHAPCPECNTPAPASAHSV